MGKIAFVFSGQGDQYPGMGKDLVEKYPVAASVFEMCDGIRPGTLRQCMEGTEEELKETANTQPCLFAMELAATEVLKEKGICPDVVAGFSLGEVVAATAAGVFDNETGFELVCKRGKFMQQESEKFDTAMAAVVKLTPAQVEAVCEKYEGIYPVNYNCPGQVSVSGLAEVMPQFSESIRAEGGRVIPLKVKGAFHSPFMKEAAEAFTKELEMAKIGEQMVPLYSNLTATPYSADVVDLLSKQICNPVRWEEIICNMIVDGVDTFVEIGPGKTLTNMIKKIDPEVKAINVSEMLAEVEAC